GESGFFQDAAYGRNQNRAPGFFSRGSAGALRRPPGTRFLCKKPVPGPSGKNSNLLAVYQGCVDGRGFQIPLPWRVGGGCDEAMSRRQDRLPTHDKSAGSQLNMTVLVFHVNSYDVLMLR